MNATTEWFTVEEFQDGWYQIIEGRPVLPCYMYVFPGANKTILIDTGLGIGDLRKTVQDSIGQNIRVLLTHSHWDHLGAAHQFNSLSIHEHEQRTDGVVAIDVLSDDYDERPSQFIHEWVQDGHPLPDEFDPNEYQIKPVEDVATHTPGETIDIGERSLELVPIPGHSPGLVAVLDRDTGICHGSDIMEPGGGIYAHFQTSDVQTYRDSIAHLIELRDENAFDTLTLGHGEALQGTELDILNDVLAAFDAILAETADFHMVETPWGPTRCYTVQGIDVLTKS